MILDYRNHISAHFIIDHCNDSIFFSVIIILGNSSQISFEAFLVNSEPLMVFYIKHVYVYLNVYQKNNNEGNVKQKMTVDKKSPNPIKHIC